MLFNTSYPHIITDESLMETARHGNPDYPFHFYYENMGLFDFNCVDWHWHSELEFVFIESGTVTMWIGDRDFGLNEGDALFINTKMLHKFHSTCAASIPNFLFKPSFISPEDSLIFKKYVLPVTSSSIPYLIFRGEERSNAAILSDFRKIIQIHKDGPANELLVSSLIQHLWLSIYHTINFDLIEEKQIASAASLSRLQMMMQFIHENYAEDISLDDISGEVSVSKSTALNLFKQYLHMTPVNYLIAYRLKTAAAGLSGTEKKISTISAECGFKNLDHFCRTFKKHYELTPSEYRKSKLLGSK